MAVLYIAVHVLFNQASPEHQQMALSTEVPLLVGLEVHGDVRCDPLSAVTIHDVEEQPHKESYWVET